MANPYRTVISVIAGVTLLQAAGGLLAVLLPLRMAAEGFPLLTIGAVATAHGLGMLIGGVVSPGLIAQIGHIRAFAACAATLSATALALASWVSPGPWILLRLLGGVCFAGLFTVAEAWIADRTPAALRGRVLGFYMVCSKAALAGSPLLLIVYDLGGLEIFLLASALLSLALLPVTTTRARSPAAPALSGLGPRKLYAIAPVGVVGCFAVGLVNAPVLALAPVYGAGLGLELARTALLVPALHLGSLIFQWPLGRLSDHRDRRVVIAVLTLLVAAISLALAFGSQLPPGLIPWLLFAWGGAGLSIYAICVAHAGDHAPPGQMVPLISSLLFAWAVGAVIGPMLATAVMSWRGVGGLFTYAGGVSLLFFGFIVWRMRSRRASAEEAQVHFVNLPATSPTVAEIGASGSLRQPRAADPEPDRSPQTGP